jgi:DNA polymerase III sliding clamp (beta) subunit (PCNA family)
MKFCIEKGELLKAVISMMVPKAKCDLLNLKVHEKEIILSMITENGELQIINKLKTGIEKIEELGSATVSLPNLALALKNLQAESIDASIKENFFRLETINTVLELPLKEEIYGLAFEKKKDEKADIIALFAETLWEALNKVAFAASGDNLRLSGVLLEFKDDKMTAVATDAKRIARFTVAFLKPLDFERKIILPIPFVYALLNVLPKVPEPALIKLWKEIASFEINGLCITGRLIDTDFPEYNQFFEGVSIFEATALKEEFSQALKEISSIDSDWVNLHFRDESLSFFTENPFTGRAFTKILLKMAGKEAERKFNLRFLKEGVNKFNSNQIILEFKESSPTMVISPCKQSCGKIYLPFAGNEQR